ncbi:PucR family transcriptional regulator [Nocardia sp. alder85J]|uniref:PucR family transcriptional regulator n=1 Tax=Nocardia sp. alder85J TaxID=2862949 RepID=UPI001CD45FE8|nr:PucR family transcriptional regulator [Nocardia sp. alder85J]MCX4097114.1 helix-turn-helix domain-containing protein [Nocardia sp. alder85J]
MPRFLSLSELLSSLTNSVATLVDAPAGADVVVDQVAFLDAGDLMMDLPPGQPLAEAYLQVGVGDREATQWLCALARECPAADRPRVLFSKSVTPELRAAAAEAGIALVAVHPQARWEMVYSLIDRITGHSAGAATAEQPPALDTDLFGLAQSVAASTRGLVSIEDDQFRVLAYSADNAATADPVRRLSVLGRQGPSGYMRWLQREGVFDRLRNSGDTIEVPPQPEWETRRRIAIGIREPGRHGGRSPAVLGTIWVQEGGEPLDPDSPHTLRGAASIAARVIWRARRAPTSDALLIQRLFGAHGGGVDVAAFAHHFGVHADGPAAVVGFARCAEADEDDEVMQRAIVTLRLHASAFRQDCLTTLIGPRLYVLFPEHHSVDRVASWARQVIGRLGEHFALELRGAIAAPVEGLADVTRARAEVDRVLDRTTELPGAEAVTTLARSRTTVLLAEILAAVGERADLQDPRVDLLVDYDRRYSAQLCQSLDAYLRRYGDVRSAAADLGIHPNTLRYRIRRAADLMGIDLDSAADRLLLEIQLAARRAGSGEQPPEGGRS